MSQPPWSHLVDLARDCAVRIEGDAGQFLGSGFFVAAGQVLTCAHVAGGEPASRLRLRWSGIVLRVARAVCVPERRGAGKTYAIPDVALLTLDTPLEHPVVWLSRSVPPAWTRAVAIGFSEHTPADHPAEDTESLQVVGSSAPPLLKVRDGRIPKGMSGSLVLDVDAGMVCGLVKAAADDPAVTEAWILPSLDACAVFDGLAAANSQEHPRGSAWWELATHRTELNRRLFGVADPAGTPKPPADPPPSWWLDPANQVVVFHPRPELDALLAWATDETPGGPVVKLVYGPGGTGKTRLALELAGRLFRQGWVAGVRRPPEAGEVHRLTAIVGEAAELGHRVLLAFDYVEGYRDELERLVAVIDPDAVRILLLARSAGPWWRRFSPDGAARYRVAREPVVLGPPGTGPADMRAAFAAALQAFRNRLHGGGTPGAVPGSADYRDMLTLQAAALISALHERDHGSLPQGRVSWTDPLDELVRHEQRHLERAGRRFGLDCDPQLAGEALLLPSLFAARNAAQAGELVGRLAAISGHQARPLAVLLHELYPSPSVLRWWAPLPLDRLAETLLVQVVEEAWDAPAYLQGVFAASAVWPAVEGLVLMLRVLVDHRVPEAVRQHVDAGLDSVVRGRGCLLLPALWVAETRVHGEAPLAGRYVTRLSGEDALALVDVLRRSGRRSLLEFALVLLDRVDEAARAAGAGGSAPRPMLVVLRAMILVLLERYAEAMRLTGGLLDDLRSDVARRTAYDVPPDQHLIHIGTRGDVLRMTFSPQDGSEVLAMALQVHAVALEGDEQEAEALTLRAEACEVARRGALWNPDLELRLIHYLCELAGKHIDRDGDATAEPLLVEAVERAQARPEDTLSTPVVLLARVRDRQGRHAEAAALQRQVAHADDAELDPETAVLDGVLGAWRHCTDLAEQGRLTEARAAAQAYLTGLRDLADEDRKTYGVQLALALLQAAELESQEAKLELCAEAIQMLRDDGQAAPPELHALGLAQLTFGDALDDLGRTDEALAAATEAVRHLDRYAEHAPGKAVPRLVIALHLVTTTALRTGSRELAAEAARRTEDLLRRHAGDVRLPELGAVQTLRFQEVEALRADAQREAGRAAELLRRASAIARELLGRRTSANNRDVVAGRLLAVAHGLLDAGDIGAAAEAVDAVLRSGPADRASTTILAHLLRVHIRNRQDELPVLAEAMHGLLAACRQTDPGGERGAVDEAVQWVQALAHRPEAAQHQDAVLALFVGVLRLPADLPVTQAALAEVLIRITVADLPAEAGPALVEMLRRYDDPDLAQVASMVAVKMPLDARHAVFAELDRVIRGWTGPVREQHWQTVAMVPWLRSQALTEAGRHDEAVAAIVDAVPWMDAHREQDPDMFRAVVRGYLEACRDAGRPQDAVDIFGALSADSLALLMESATTRAYVLGWQAETAGRLGDPGQRSRLAAEALVAAYVSGELAVIHRAHRDHARALWLADSYDPAAFAHLIAAGVIGAVLHEPFDGGWAGNLLDLQLGRHDLGTVAALAGRVDTIDGVRFGTGVLPVLGEDGQRALDAVLDVVISQSRSGRGELAGLLAQWDCYIAAIVRIRHGEKDWAPVLHRLLRDYAGTDWAAVARGYVLLAEGHDAEAVAAGGDAIDELLIARCRNAVRGAVPIPADLAYAMPDALLLRQLLVAISEGRTGDADTLVTYLDDAPDAADLARRLRSLIGGDRDPRLAATPNGRDRAVLRMMLDALC